MKAKVYYNYRYDRVLSGKEKLFATHQILTTPVRDKNSS